MSEKDPEYSFELAGLGDGNANLDEFIRKQILSLLDIVILTEDGNEVNPDGYLFQKDAFKEDTIVDRAKIKQIYLDKDQLNGSY